MQKEDFERILELLAEKEGITKEQVRREMMDAMEEAMNHPDPIVQMRWKFVPHKGERPTLEEFVGYLLRFVE